MNVVCLVGRIIAEPELRNTPQGTPVCTFPVAVNRPTKGENGYYESDVIRCVAWRQTAEFVSRYFHQHSNIGVNGSIRVNSYNDKETGKKLSSWEVQVNNVYFVDSRNSNSSGAGSSQPSYSPQPERQESSTFPANSFSTGDFDGFSAVSTDDGDLPF